MNVMLEAIKFNHNPNLATHDAFNIRRNETEQINVPEWRRGISINPEDSPAAYARDAIGDNDVTIKAKFSCDEKKLKRVWLRALDGQVYSRQRGRGNGFSRLLFLLVRPFVRDLIPSNVLGSVPATEVLLTNGESDWVTIGLADQRIRDVGVTVTDIIWRWQFSFDAQTWQDCATTPTSVHRIYTTLRLPTEPWNPRSSNTSNVQVPWTDVLDYACRWAEGSQLADEAAAFVTRSVNALGYGNLEFDLVNHGKAHYTKTSPPLFDGTAFLNLLRGNVNESNGRKVNCQDCATFNSTIANILGCELSQSSMGSDFPLNLHRRIGIPGWMGNRFMFHTVAWKGKGKEADELFDACLEVDGDDDPNVLTARLPTNMRFGLSHEREYRFRLVEDKHQDECNPIEGTTRRRKLGHVAAKHEMINDERWLVFGKKYYSYQKWADRNKLAETLFVQDFRIDRLRLPGFQLSRIDRIELEDRAPIIQSFWRIAKGENSAIRIDVHECQSRKEAHFTLLEHLCEFQLPGMTLQSDDLLGDVAFFTESDLVSLFARANLVFLLMNVANEANPVSPLARVIDQQVSSYPVGQGPNLSRFNHFYFDVSEAKVKDQVRIQVEAVPPFDRVWLYKFFSKTGEVFQQEAKLVYEPNLPGTNELKIFAVNERGLTVSQSLKLTITG